jgi:hypothetical protein
MTVLAVLPWNTCNARCAHCGPNSGPKDRTRISHDDVIKLIREAGARYAGKDWCLSLSGGEIFLHYDELLRFCQEAKRLGGYTTLITNGFWATSVEKAEQMLTPLKAADLRILGMSVGRYHSEYIPPERVAFAIKAARRIGLRPHIRMAATKSFRLWQMMSVLAEHGLWFVDFMEMPITPAGRAEFEIDVNEFMVEDELPLGGCPAPGLTINPQGEGMFCCNGAGEYGLSVGNIRNYSYDQLEERFDGSLLLDFLLKFGPAKALDLLEPDDAARLRTRKYVSVCHLCTEVIRDPARLALLESRVADWYRARLKAWMPDLALAEETAP